MSTPSIGLEAFLRSRLPPEVALDLPAEVLAALLIYNVVRVPEDVMVKVRGGDGVVALEFDVGYKNKGRVIGKNGHIIKSIRSLCRSSAKARGKDIILDLVGWESDD